MTRIVILGGGYTGIAAAIRAAVLTRRHGGAVTLVNASATFTERLRLHQTAAGQRLREHAVADVLAGTGVTFVHAAVTGIDADRREVRLGDGRALGYDRLVYALGTVTDASTPGVAEHAFTYDDHDQALRLAARLDELEPGGAVVVAGGGLTGVESAAELAQAHPGLRVVLVSRGAPGAMMGPKARAYLDRALRGLNVEVRSGGVTKVLPGGVELDGGGFVPAGATLWTTGTRGLPLAAEAGLTVDARGRIVVDEALRSVSHPDVYAVGDAAAVSQPFGVLHGTCQGGIPVALHAAGALADELRGRRPRPFRFGYVHQPVSLGRGDAVIQFTHRDDTPRRWRLTGRWAAAYKEAVSSSPLTTYRLLKRGLVPVALFRLTALPR